MKGLLAILGSAPIGLMLGTGADAANPEPVTVGMNFVDPITIAKTVNLQFGLLDLNMALNDTVTINPDDTWSDPQTNVVGGTQAAARLTITATAAQSITITADNPSNGTYYNLDSFMCNYAAAGSDSACDTGYTETSVASATLLVGAKLTGLSGAVASTDDSTFDVTVTYQ
jgi:hypothetical protein